MLGTCQRDPFARCDGDQSRLLQRILERARVHRAEDFNTWAIDRRIAAQPHRERLEIGPGLHPRVPIAGSFFVDISAQAVERLKALGGSAVLGEITALPFRRLLRLGGGL